MRTTRLIGISAGFCAVIALAAAAQTPVRLTQDERPRPHPHPHVHVVDPRESEMTITESETIEKSFSLPRAEDGRSVNLDNVWGAIHVTGVAGDQVHLVAHKTLRAESKDALELAKKEVTLDITQQGSLLKLYVNGPFRCQCEDCVSIRRDSEYIVQYDFELQVPHDTDLTARTVNDGDVTVQDVAGRLSVHNVNGGVAMTNVAGSGQAKTVNGELKVLFRENPSGKWSFATINGDVNLYFQPRLSADFRFKTFNGEVFSDFDVSALPVRQAVEQKQGNKFIFQADRYTGARIGSGGPEIQIETLNGDIHIRERHD
jgi:hypothetical protein